MKGGAIPKVYTDEEILDLLSVTTDTIPNLRRNSALHAFEISILNTWSIHNMLDGVRDVFNDAAGILSGGSVSGGVLTFIFTNPVAISTDMPGGTPANAIDGNEGTIWDSDNAANWLNKYITLDVGHPVTALGVTELTHTGQDIDFNFDIYGSNDDVEFTLLDSVVFLVADKGVTTTYPFDNGTAWRYYKLVCNTSDLGIDLDFYILGLLIREIISESVTAESQPSNAHVVILADDAAITLNTDFKFYVSVDDGATWEQITLEDSGDYSATEKILTGSVAVAGTGTTIKYKIECTDADFEFYAVGLLWD